MKAKLLVVDTAAFVKNVPLWELGEEIYSVTDVIDEIKDRHTRYLIGSLPVVLNMRQPQPESFKLVTDFSKRTGDYPSLSLTDLKVLAVTYDLEVEANDGSAEHLNKDPKMRVVDFGGQRDSKVNGNSDLPVGFYMPSRQEKSNSHVVGTVEEKEENLSQAETRESVKPEKEETLSRAETRDSVKPEEGHENEEICTEEAESLTEECCNIESSETVVYNSQQGLEERQDHTHEGAGSVVLQDQAAAGDEDDSWTTVSHVSKQNRNRRQRRKQTGEYLASTSALESANGAEVVPELNCGEESDPEQEAVDDSCDDDDEEGWITKEVLTLHNALKEGIVKVACITSDFAMQNVLKQLGIPVMGVDGRMIGDVRTFILRCHTCFKTTSVMTSVFCPKCGNKTLKRVSVTINPDGTQRIWINTKRPINTRGMKYSLPMPRGGKHAVNPLVVVDQREARQFPSKLAKKKCSPMDVDYIAGQSAFATRDVYSRASKLGYVGGKHHCGRFYWEQRNPNVPMKNAKKRK